MDKNIVTRGVGFIGSHISEELVNKGHHVLFLDSLRIGFKKNIEHLDVEFVEGDIVDRELLAKISDGAKGIFHFASLASVPKSLQSIEECIRNI